MSGLYKRIEDLCNDKKISITTMCKESGASRASLSDLKKGRKQNLSSETLLKIAVYFGIPSDYLIGTPPFDCWELINSNRKRFLSYVNYNPSVMQWMWNIDPSAPEKASIKDFILFISSEITEANITDNGDWIVRMWGDETEHKKAPTNDGERVISDLELKFALWGDCDEISDDDLADVRRYAAFVRERKKDNKK